MNVRVVVLLLALLSVVSTALGGYLYYESVQESAFNEAEKQVLETSETLREHVLRLISVHKNEVRALAQFEELADALTSRHESMVDRAEHVLDHFAMGLSYDVCFLIDAAGTAIASSNRHQPDSFVGHNYAFRSYFQRAIQGVASSEWALGVVSGVRGIYFSHPIYGENKSIPIGVVVMKAPLHTLDKAFERVKNMLACLVHQTGMIFVSSDPRWTMSLLWRASPKEESSLAETRLFGDGPWEWTGFSRTAPNEAIDKSGEVFLVKETDLEDFEGWRLFLLYSPKFISAQIVKPLVGNTGYAALFLFLVTASAVTVLYSLAQKDIRSRREAEHRINESLSLLHSSLESTADGILVVDREGKIVFSNEQFVTMWQIPQDILQSGDDKRALDFVLKQLKDPEGFLQKVTDLYNKPKMESFDLVEFKDGKAFERYSKPQWLGDDVVGRVWSFRDVTKRYQTETEVRVREQTLRTILSTSPIGIAFTQDRIIKWVNDAWLGMFGFNQEECIGQSVRIIYSSQEDFEQAGGILYSGLTDGQVTEAELSFRRKDGSVFDGFTRMKAVDPSDLSKGTISALADVSDRKLMARLLSESEEKYRILVERAMEGICVAQGGFLSFLNPAALNILGYSHEELTQKPFTEFIHVDDRNMVYERYSRRLRGEQIPSRYSFRVIRKDGCLRWVEIDSGLIAWDGNPATLFFINDITERKDMEEELRQSEAWYRSLVENSFDGLFVQQGLKIVFANTRLHQMLGYSPGELHGLDHWVVYHPDYRDLTRSRALARLRGEEVTPQYEIQLQKKDGSSFFGEVSAKPVTVRGKPGVQVWVRDVSKTKRSLDAQRRLATVVKQATEGIVIMDSDWNVIYVNPAFERITGSRADEVIGKKSNLFEQESLQGMSEDQARDLLAKGLGWTGRLTKRRGDGTLYHEDVTISPVRDETGNIVNYVGIKRDVTKEFALQEQLLQAQKMEAVGTLAGGIAHDFNNLLQIVLGYSQFLAAKINSSSPEFESFQKIISAAQRGGNLVKGLLTFSRKAATTLRPLNINDQVTEVKALLDRTVPKMVRIEIYLQENLPNIYADPTQMQQILINLAVNAKDAMPDGGTLTIETNFATIDPEFSRTHSGLNPGDYVTLIVSDTGHGMNRDVLQHVFEPFYSTKDVGKGTGLGLAMVYGIVKQHDGYIMCESEPDRGTTFRLFFPLVNTDSAQPEAIYEPSDLAGGSETLLLVDDEEFVRGLGSDFLGQLGYTVLTASHGAEAVETYREHQAAISLVILDLNMPQMGGKQCLEELLKLDPSVRVIIASGYSSTGLDDAVLTKAKGFVEKPYDIVKLVETIRAVLDES